VCRRRRLLSLSRRQKTTPQKHQPPPNHQKKNPPPKKKKKHHPPKTTKLSLLRVIFPQGCKENPTEVGSWRGKARLSQGIVFFSQIGLLNLPKTWGGSRSSPPSEKEGAPIVWFESAATAGFAFVFCFSLKDSLVFVQEPFDCVEK